MVWGFVALLALLGPSSEVEATIACPGGVLLDKHVCVPSNYSKQLLPMAGINDVNMDILVMEISTINNLKMTYTMRIKLTMEWNDPRIETEAFPVTGPKNRIVPGNSVERFLWRPDIFIYDVVKFKQDAVYDSMSGVTVSENRTVTYYTYATVEIKCKMNFEYFPFDTQNCKFMVSSTSYDSDHLRLTASHERIKTERLQAYDAALIALPSDPEERIHGFPGNFSRAGFILTIKRISNTYKYKFIFPAAAMVCLSFISFLIDPMKQIPGRMALLITMFLVMQSLNQTIDKATPLSGKITTISAYMIICSTFLFFALVEFAIVLLIRRYEENRKIREDEQGKTKEEKDAMQDELRTKAWSQLTKEEKKKMNLKKWYMAKVMGKFDDLAYKIDKICLIIFMILFFLYNLVYYLLNTTFQDVEGEEE